MTDGDAGIVLTIERGVATITLAREAKRNALAQRHFLRLADLLRDADANGDVKVIVLTGAGERAFCAGADLSPDEAFVARLGDVATTGHRTGLGDVMRAAYKLSKPLVGRINGHCYAGGVGLLSMCDVAIAVDDARFALPEVNLGLFPFVVAAGLKHKMRPEDIDQLATSGQPISAARAHEIGLIAQAVPRARLDAAIAEVLRIPARTLMASRAAWATFDFDADVARAEASIRELAASRHANDK